MTITYAIEKNLGWEEFADRRPVDRPEVIRGMVENAGLVISARDGDGRLIGVARSLTDFAYCCYLSDLECDRFKLNQFET